MVVGDVCGSGGDGIVVVVVVVALGGAGWRVYGR